MNMAAEPIGEGAASAAPMGGVEGMGAGFSATVAVSKTIAQQNLVHIDVTSEPTQM